MYQSYLEPFFRHNEQELEQGILSAQSTVVTFAQAKFQAAWEAIWNMTNKNPTNSRAGAQGQQRPGAPSPHQSYQGQPGAAPSPYDAARQLFNAYAPGVFGSLVSGTASANPNTRPSPKPTASSSSTSFGNGSTPPHQRSPGTEGNAPSFPQPRFH